jgi:ABC-type Fe3+-citrate transport system substrate-binding protein
MTINNFKDYSKDFYLTYDEEMEKQIEQFKETFEHLFSQIEKDKTNFIINFLKQTELKEPK